MVIALTLLGTYSEIKPGVQMVAIAGVLTLLALQAIFLALVHRARVRNESIPTVFVVASVVVESVIPTAMMLWSVVNNAYPPYAAITSPPLLAYGIMITLTTLRLRPWLCVVAGACCALSYAGLFLYVRYGMGAERPPTGLPYAAYINAPLIIFFTGLAAAWVAREVRTHMEAALGETESRHQIARLEKDLSVARTIQQALLPRRAPEIPGFEVAGWNRSADLTGGDYYDWQLQPDGGWIVTLADVSGHGIGPAMVTAACRAYMRAGSHYHPDLGSLTSRINQLLSEDLPEGRFVTLVGVHINANGGPLHLLSAGHGPIVLYIRATGEAQDIMPQDQPLAIIPEATFGPAQEITLAPGDMIALVTDGFVEWAKPGADGHRDEFGMDRLRDSLKRNAHLPAAALIEAVAAEVSAFAGGVPQQDDLTMVIIRRNAAS